LIQRVGDGWNRFWYTPADPFPLAIIRIATGLVAIYVHAIYTFDIVHYFATGGLLPVALVDQLYTEGVNPVRLSYLAHLRTPAELYVAHALGAVVLVLFTIGLFSRITSILALIITLSYIHRGPMVTCEVEPILTMLQFYLCLGPCGACLSVDRWLARRREKGPRANSSVVNPSVSANVAIRLVQVHTTVIYLMMGLAKVSGPGGLEDVELWMDPWGTGQAVWILIARPISPMVDLTWLHAAPYLVQAWSHAIVLFELLFGVLVWNRTLRPLLLGVAVVMWGALALVSGVAVLSVLMLTANLSFFSATSLRSWFHTVTLRPRSEQTV
jgi:hypothetical protein